MILLSTKTGFSQALEIMEKPGKSRKKGSMYGKIVEVEKPE